VAEPLDAEVFYLPPEKELRAEIDRRREAGKLPGRVHRAIPEHRGESDSQRLFEAAWLGPWLREAGVAHVHAHFGGMAARTAWWLRKLHGIPYSFTGHANDIFCETDFPISNAMLARDAAFIVTETDYARKWMEEKHPFTRGKVRRVFNGIALDGFPAPHPAGPPPRVFSVGRYVEKKGFADLIAACALLRDQGRAFECLIAGGGPLEADLQDRIERANLGSWVKLLGPRPQSEVRQLLAEATVFVLPCVREAGGGSDNLPTVIMEAMACGIPVVSTPIAGVPEMITDGQDGLLAPSENPPAVAAAIGRLLEDRTLAARLASAARETALAKFAIEKTTAELKRLLIERAGLTPPPAALQLDPALASLRPPGLFARLWRRRR
jgi:glycosyltransferase involved in cell wall biosynthesis